jgi:hypothetical protein
MKKIILAIFTIMLTLAIFGCGKMQQASGGGSSSGGGGGTSQTFSVKGKVYGAQKQAQTSGMSAQAAGDYTIKVLQFADDDDNNPLGNGTWHPDAAGEYKIDGLPLGKVFVVVVEKGSLQMKNLAFGSSGDRGKTKTADLTPTSTVTVEVISANAAEMLKNFNENTNIDAAVEEVQSAVNTNYADGTKFNILLDAINNGTQIDTSGVSVQTYTLTVVVNPANSGTVIPNSGTYLKNTKVKLQAQASSNDGWSFKEWSGGLGSDNPVETTITANITVTASFKNKNYIVQQTADWSKIDYMPLEYTHDPYEYIKGIKTRKDADNLYFRMEFNGELKNLTDTEKYKATFEIINYGISVYPTNSLTKKLQLQKNDNNNNNEVWGKKQLWASEGWEDSEKFSMTEVTGNIDGDAYMEFAVSRNHLEYIDVDGYCRTGVRVWYRNQSEHRDYPIDKSKSYLDDDGVDKEPDFLIKL